MPLRKRRRAPITTFSGRYEFLSNFYQGEPLVYQGDSYPTAEHLFQAMKTCNLKERAKIRRARTPGVAKRLGRQVTLRPAWDTNRRTWMGLVLAIKFKDPELRRQLLATGDARLVEGNTWGDTYWGESPPGYGENHLGKLLVKLRRRLRQEMRDGTK